MNPYDFSISLRNYEAQRLYRICVKLSFIITNILLIGILVSAISTGISYFIFENQLFSIISSVSTIVFILAMIICHLVFKYCASKIRKINMLIDQLEKQTDVQKLLNFDKFIKNVEKRI